MNATILDGAEIEDWSIIAAGSLISPRTKIESESLVKGVPGKVVRKLEQKDKDYIVDAYQNYLEKIKSKSKEIPKSPSPVQVSRLEPNVFKATV